MNFSTNSFKLDEDYRIERDQYSWILVYEHLGEINEETGNPTRTIKRTYHGNLKQVVEKYCDNCLKVSDSIQDILSKLEELNRNIILFTNILKLK